MSPPAEVVTIGETMGLFAAPDTGPLGRQSAMRLSIGGAESNCAIALRRLGTSVTWVGKVGADSLGELVLRELRAEGLELVASRHPVRPTGLMLKERRTVDATKVWYYRSGSAGSALSVEDIPEDAIAAARLLHITGITPGLSDSAAQAVDFAIYCARQSGTLVSFDFNYRSALWSGAEAGAVFRQIVARADIVFAGQDEAALVVGPGSPREQSARLAELGPSQVMVKLGDRGCAAMIEGEYFEEPAPTVRVVDTVGAGDAFVAGYLSELLCGSSPRERLRTATAVGAFACSVEGDWEGSPRRDELALVQATEPVSR